MAHDSRLGLATVPSAAGITPGYLDAQQWVKAIAAAKTTLSNMLGGEGIYSGGATVVGDLPTAGTQYPVTTLIVYDDSGYAWPFVVAAAKDISFTDTSGAGALYAVIKQLGGVSPAAAVGGLADVEFVAQLAATAAPANSLKLGTGTITASAFTTWSEEATARVAAGDGLFARLDLAEVVTGLWRFGVNTLRVGDGTDATITLLAHNADEDQPGLRYDHSTDAWQFSNDGETWSAVVGGDDARLSNARTPTSHATSHKHGGSDEVGTATPAANAIPKANGSGKLDAWVSDASTTVKGKVELATDGESAAGVAVQGNDSRLSNARTPTAHQASHAVGGADALSAADLGLGTVRGTYTRTVNQTIAHATTTDVIWTVRADHAGLDWTTPNATITVGAGEGGQYLIVSQVEWALNTTGWRGLYLTVNGTLVSAPMMMAAATDGYARFQLVWQGALAAGDTLKLAVRHIAGANLDVDYTDTWLRVVRLWG